MDLVEEAIHLLRMAPGAVVAGYYIGSLPFILGLLFFWTDMSRSPYADQHLTEAALGLALLFLWMKLWQSIFTSNLRAYLTGEIPKRWNLRRWMRVLIIQTALQPTAVFMLPLAAIPMLPFGWVYAFYQNVTALSDGETSEVGPVFKRAARQATLWPGQNHVILLVLLGFAFCIFVNLASVGFIPPKLAKMLLGIESVYTQSPFSLLNTTFFAAILGLTYLCVDPIIKAVYLLRCFYGESLQSGEDLKAELKQFAPSAAPVMAALLLLLALAPAPSLQAEDAAPSAAPAKAVPAAAISTPKLDKAIDDVIHETKYTWRMPREKKVKDETAASGPVGRFFESIAEVLKRWFNAIMEWLGKLIGKWFRHNANESDTERTGLNWVRPLQMVFFVLIVCVACTLVIFLIRVWQRRRRKPATVASEAIFPMPDIADENVGAEQLPEDGWIKLGRELLGRGELRLAMRAFYFASLAHLSARNLITIAKFKSNRDYERELRRRGHALPDLLLRFGENVVVFDRSWYGMHEVSMEMVGQFAANVERIKAGR
jgi:hypothetical protein